MEQIFYKYQGAGNDFVMIDNRHQIFDKKDTKQIVLLCDRRFGVGADGLILIENHNELDFEMIYYNADASQSFCGNGGRCAVAFAKKIGIIKDSTVFKAIDGVHKASISKGIVRLHMADVDRIEKHENHIFLNTGSPHHVQLENNIDDFDINYLGAKIRYGEPYNETGSNVNFVKKVNNNTFRVRTYERGVEFAILCLRKKRFSKLLKLQN